MQTVQRRWLLRERTAGAHAAVDSAVGEFGDLQQYKAYLLSIAAFRSPLERQLGRVAWPAGLGDWRPASVAADISRDLDDLGLAARGDTAASIDLAGDRLYGALYVLEGSALGATVLFRRAQALGLSASHGARHLAALSANLDGWRDFLVRLDAATPFDLDSAVDGSVAAFALARKNFEAV